ncbi:histidine kinase [Nitrosomonas sp. HPC101]|uniref:sensor histidine kinase n=1 Tax=Nitrosomonas sp. HPC101 TaxID=1658667 RepID=UPI00136E2EBA|nr:HAMP domain-containing sensor histidine kinase [Nitrosomonas sp. HPC101]MXS86350.1 histidine kinase [Nitrosomonas sp. HPC101]
MKFSTDVSPSERMSRKNRSRYKPKSFLALILIGFSIVGLPLISALIYSAIRIDQLSEQSRYNVYHATQITNGTSVIIGEIMAMERSVQHALVLDDATLLEGYFIAHTKFESITNHLSIISTYPEQQLSLEKLRLLETGIFREILDLKTHPQDLQYLLDRFAALLNLAREFSTDSFRMIGQSVGNVSEIATQTRSLVEWELLILVPLVIFLALIFSVFIARPVRQIDEAIAQMGRGNLSRPIHVNGPQNLTYIGERLDWLRLRLLRLENQKIQFFRHISHELKTPLTAIREGADLLAEGVTGTLNRKQQVIAGILHTSSMQLQKRIEDLLNFSALQAEIITLVKQRVNLKKLINSVIRAQNLSILSKSLTINLNCPELFLECDIQKLDVMLDNLLSNAVKFSPEYSHIEITVLYDEDKVQIDIMDSGPGVASIDEDRVFEPFYQGRNTPENHAKGTGLGLAIAKEYAVAHGGNIELVRNTGKCGAHFRLMLPINRSEST